MDQNDNSQNDFLHALLADPAIDASAYLNDLNRLVTDHPQSGILQALLARASEEKNLKRASAYFDPRLLYKLINNPSLFSKVDAGSIYIQPSLRKNQRPVAVNAVFHAESNPEQPVSGNYFSEQPISGKIEDETQPLPSLYPELSPIEDTEVAEHRLDEQVIADNEVIDSPAGVIEPAYIPVEFHPGRENIMSFEETSSLENESAEAVTGNLPVNNTFDAIANDPLYSIEKDKDDPSLVDKRPAETDNHTADLSIQTGGINSEDKSYTGEMIIQENLNPEIPVEDTYSGLGKVNSGNDDSQLTDEIPAKAEDAAFIGGGEDTRYEPERAVTIETPKGNDIEDDVYDEIMGIEQIQLNNASSPPAENNQDELISDFDEEENKLIIENIASTDFFMFDDAFGNKQEQWQQGAGLENTLGTSTSEPAVPQETTDAPVASPGPVTPHAEANVLKEEQQDVSKYNDDKMPYTFMWWLDKTRREHAGVSQPYAEKPAEPEKPLEKQPEDVLQQQYYSNIFHISSIKELSEDEASRPFSFGIKKRSQQIIEKFIKEEPQIKPQSSDKLDSENKAKKSSEDRDEIVTETLAAIYAEQMLYYKAIAAYKKLIVKFPEKSSYFADKIEQLNKKIN